MSVARHHAEWLSLVENSGPFVSMPVLLRVFPQGLDELETKQRQVFREAYDEWLDRGARKAAVHRAWALHVLTQLLGYPPNLLVEGQAMPPGMEATMALYGEVLRPDFALMARKNEAASSALQHSTFNLPPCLLISLYPPEQDLDKPVFGKVWKACPNTRMMELLHATGVPVGLVTNGEHWMLVYAPRGETTGFASWYADLWTQEPLTLRAFVSLFHLRRFLGVTEGDTLTAILKESAKDQQDVTDQLGYQVRQAVEVLVQAFDRLDAGSGRTLLAGVTEKTLYDAALTVMMRLVFMFAAEERGMLLLRQNPLYDEYYALSALRDELRERADQHGEEVLERRHDAWCRLLATFRAVHGGVEHESMRLPAYGGTLFDPDRFAFLEGRSAGTKWTQTAAKPLGINNRVVLHLLEALQILQVKVPGGGGAEARRLSFRALDIEQIGHVYEGLLDHTAKRSTETVLGLAGAKNKEPEIPLSRLEQLAAGAVPQVLAFPAGEEPLRLAAEKPGEMPLGKRDGPPAYDDPSPTFVEFLTEATGRSASAIAKALKRGYEADPHKLSIACGHDTRLEARVLPFAGLLRQDSFGQLVVIPEGSVYVTSGSDRRSTGTHYTPRSLTEPIVKHTLEPLVYVGPAEGKPENEWQLKSPKEILDLKVCDMAMGSGAFLVQACRYLSERLVESWEAIEKASSGKFLKTPEGDTSDGDPRERLLPLDPTERLAIARRYVADRCLYGVDINPMAVEMAKLSLWLVTIQKDRPFTFLDHALKYGDSLLGVSKLEQIENFRLRSGKTQHTFATINLFRYVEEAAAKRRTLETLPSETHAQLEQKQRLHTEAHAATEKAKAIADLLIALELQGLGEREHDRARETETERIQDLLKQDCDAKSVGTTSRLACAARDALAGRQVFHWALEFPEVFSFGGFNAFIGNPPFAGGKRISSFAGDEYLRYIKTHLAPSVGSADLSAYFFLRATRLLRPTGTFGLLATNTIAQGDTREVGLDHIVKDAGCEIVRAVNTLQWPGYAAVFVSLVYVMKGKWDGVRVLDGQTVECISSFLDTHLTSAQPHRLAVNDGISHMGTNVFGAGFRMSETEAQRLIQEDSRYVDVLFPFLNGIDINSDVRHKAPQWVINFHDWSLEQAARYPKCLAIVREKVLPLREQWKGKREGTFWWLYARRQENLYEAIRGLDRCLVTALTSDTMAFALVEPNVVFSNATIVFAWGDYAHFATLQSELHTSWARRYGSTMKGDARYTPTDCFQTYPFTKLTDRVQEVGAAVYEHRRATMIARNEGLTSIYHRFHARDVNDRDITQLRALHVEMDQAVSAAYGWTDLALGHGFHETKQGIRYTISESARRAVLDRLLALNHQRYEEEGKAGLHEKKTRPATRRRGNRTTEENLELGL
jgi:hypothetical protein